MYRVVSSLLFCLLIAFSTYSQSAYELYKEGKTYRKEGKKNKAIKSFEDALEAAKSAGNRELQMSCHIELAELKDNVITYKEALDHYKAFTDLYKKKMTDQNEELADSVNALGSEVGQHLETIEQQQSEISTKDMAFDSLSDEQVKTKFENQQLQIDKQQQDLIISESENKRNILMFVIGIVCLIVLFFGLGYLRKRKTNQTLRNKNYQIAKEKEKSEELLLNILPKRVAEELKEFGKTSSRSYSNATIMFTDFKGFTKFSEKLTPEEIVQIIDGYFRAFDEIIEGYDIEKIKTIGDAYMCVSGIPEETENHAHIMIKAALDMKSFVDQQMKELKENSKPYLEMRIGIHTGPLVAGVVGSSKFAYDVWGDSVNIAARMEQSGLPGMINVSESVYAITNDQFDYEYRGEVEAKNKGKMKMYFVK
ncbi:MAG: adenylate/guanylate cyclase domain-containing protein [Crocinitomicaceae bacterium]|nr:adenylate/guanylate cyclase domain-containing protein [Crocinitomicaceae bacterium]